MEAQTTGLMNYITNNINTNIIANNVLHPELLLTLTTSSNIVRSYPDPDAYVGDINFFIQGQSETIENFVSYDLATRLIKIFLVVRNDTPVNLYLKTERYTDCLKDCLRADDSIGNTYLDSRFIECRYFDGIEGSPNLKGMECTLECRYQD